MRKILFLLPALILPYLSCKDRTAKVNELMTTRTLGLAYLEEFRFEEAEKEFRKFTKLAPGDKFGYANLGLTYLRMNRYPESLKELQKALSIDSLDADVRLILATVYKMIDDTARELKELKKALTHSPAHVRTLYEISEQYSVKTDTGSSKERKKYLNRLVAAAPGNMVPKLNLAEMYIREGNLDNALEQLEIIRKQFPGFPDEASGYYTQTIKSIRKGDYENTSLNFSIFHNYIKVTAPYQAGMADLKGPGGSLIGFPVITFDLNGSGQEIDGSSVPVMVKFTDVTEASGLAAIAKFKITHVEAIDFDPDGDIDIYTGFSDPVTGIPGHALFSNNSGKFTDITREAGILNDDEEISATFGDYDNDGYPDLLIVTREGNILYRNKGNGTFKNVSQEAGLAKVLSATFATFLDADHDGDLDIFEGASGRNYFFRNNSDGTFTELAGELGLEEISANSVDAAFGDIDDDGDIDIAIADKKNGIKLFSNQRQSLFKDVSGEIGQSGGITKIKLCDYNNDGFQDLLAITEKGEALFFHNKGNGKFENQTPVSGILKPSVKFAVDDAIFIDFDNDGFSDLFATGKNGDAELSTIMLRNNGKGNFTIAENLIPKASGEKIAVFDYNDDGDQDIVITNPAGGLTLLRNDGGNNNHHVKIRLVGLRAGSAKNNHFGIGSKVEIRAGDLYQSKIMSEPEMLFGIGNRKAADVIRITWTNGVPQNIFFPAADQALVEAQTLKGSCPFLYTWNGDDFVFVKDIMWRSGLGMPLGIMGGTTKYAFANASDDYLKIHGKNLKPLNGKYVLQITSELWETIYLDRLQLAVVDHPDSTEIFVREQFTPPPFPDLEVFNCIPVVPASAIDSDGNNILPFIKAKDDIFLTDFQSDKYQGLSEMRDIILDPGNSGNDNNLILYLNGWIFPTDASINVALSQTDKLKSVPPTLYVINKEGKWECITSEMSFPMGKDKTVVVDLRGKFPTSAHMVKISTNMEIYWDHIFFSEGPSSSPVEVNILEPVSADLHYRGFSASYRKGGRYGPHWFDYSDVTVISKWRDLTGNYTKYGDVLPLLTSSDNKYIISNAGDEVTVRFDEKKLPPLKRGWKRDFLIRSVGWVKDGDINTAFGGTVEPLPYHGMKSYPPDEKDLYPASEELIRYNEEYNTRTVNTSNYNDALKPIRPDIILPENKSNENLETFSDVTERAGIDFKYTFGDDSYVNILESSGSGVTIFDYNNDGWMDILLMNGTWLEGISDAKGKRYRNSSDKLYRNNGDGTFTDVTVKAGLADTHWTMAAAPIDIDNDGDQDLFLLNYGPNVFFRNNGNGTFTDITRYLGLEGPGKLNGFTKWSIGAAFLDYNSDNKIDVMVGNFLAFDPAYDSKVTPGLMPHPSEYRGQKSFLYEQQPDGTFRDVTETSGLSYPESKCMGLCVFDYDNDGDQDIFQANDHHLNYMFTNYHGKFTETACLNGVAANSKGSGTGSMHGTPGDIDNDGLIDLLVTDLDYGALYRNTGKGLFEDVSWQSGVAWSLTGKGAWGASLFDYDNDGDLDLVSANGTAEELILQYPLLMENEGNGHFKDVGKQKGRYFNTRRSGRGLAVLDYDNDGDMDIIISHVDGDSAPALLRNNSNNKGHWLGLTLLGENPGSATSAKVTAISGGRKQVFINQFATSYLSSNDPRIHIGLGNRAIVDTLRIEWMSGRKKVLKNVHADRYLIIREGNGIEE